MDAFIKNLEIGEIHPRDRWQFELKSEYFPLLKKNVYTQELYLFIPNSLQINENTYSKAQFYKDQTNLIRYKTPEFELKELYDKSNPKSPLMRLSVILHAKPKKKTKAQIEDELKLLGNIIRSSLRERVRVLFEKMEYDETLKEETLYEEVKLLCEQLTELRTCYREMQKEFLETWKTDEMKSHFYYIDEFISSTIDYYLSGILDRLRSANLSDMEPFNKALYEVLAKEKHHREKLLKEPPIAEEDSENSEFVLYRSGLLNKFVLDALLLNTTRSSLIKRFRNVVGSISAGIAMLFFFVLFIWQGQVFFINSLPFILITVFLYIIKDRMKEGLKTISYRKFTKWFSDYKTEIRSPKEERTLGQMKESFSFVDEGELPKEITRIRNREFHAVLETFKRPERVIYYKKTITMYKQKRSRETRRNALNIISRFNINEFVRNADNPKHSYITVDPQTFQLLRVRLPKVYHLNIIMKNTYIQQDMTIKEELKKFRLILDKNGIKRVEHVHHL